MTNPRDGESPRGGSGFGLDIVRRRLRAAYGEMAAVAIESTPESFRVSVTLPYEEQA